MFPVTVAWGSRHLWQKLWRLKGWGPSYPQQPCCPLQMGYCHGMNQTSPHPHALHKPCEVISNNLCVSGVGKRAKARSEDVVSVEKGLLVGDRATCFRRDGGEREMEQNCQEPPPLPAQ